MGSAVIFGGQGIEKPQAWISPGVAKFPEGLDDWFVVGSSMRTSCW